MNNDEKIAYEYLKNKGFANIQYEPDGNVPPDFFVDNKYAIEVRRLNQHILTNDGYKGLEESDVPLYMKVIDVLSSFGKSTDHSWFVWYRFSRPVPKLKKVETELKKILIDFLKEDTGNKLDTKLDCGIEVTIFKAGKKYENKFNLAGLSDKDSGGWVIEEVDKNLRLCIEEKTHKIDGIKDKYSQWWLILVDYIGFGLDEFEQRELKDRFKFEHNWDKIIIISPSNYNKGFEI